MPGVRVAIFWKERNTRKIDFVSLNWEFSVLGEIEHYLWNWRWWWM